MAATMEDFQGSIVAFEGPADAISTQLRLLPSSPQILILPRVQQYVASGDLDGAFDATKYIRAVHNAAAARNEAAAAFLRDGCPNSKRLVFLNGGTPSAQALCVRAIAEHETDEDVDRAATIYHDMVKNGLAGLATYGKEKELSRSREEEDLDPITRAMRAADALDRQTASLQPCTDIDLTVKSRPRSMSLPLYGYADYLGESAPFYVFGANADEEDFMDEEEDEIYFTGLQSPRLQISHFDEADEDVPRTPRTPGPLLSPPRSPSCIGESYRPLSIYSSAAQDDAHSVMSTDNVVYGEAAVVRMRGTPKKQRVRRARSLDRIVPACAKYRNLPLRMASRPDVQLGVDELPADGRRFSCMDVSHERRVSAFMVPTSPRRSIVGLPRAIFVRPRKPSEPGASEKEKTRSGPSYVDRGTDAEEAPVKAEPFQTILPFTEDLVIYFMDGFVDRILDRVVKSFKDGTYPIRAPSPAHSESEPDHAGTLSTPVSRRSSISSAQTSTQDSNHTARDMIDEVDDSDDEHDPFSYRQSMWPPKSGKPMQASRTLMSPAPPTPAQTPPLPMHDAEERFHDFNTVNCSTAVTMQNSLRSILNIYFPPETNGFHQFTFPHLPELSGLWKPIFREVEPGSPHTRKDNRKVDQILAIGAQNGVKKDYLSAISGQLEKLGTKSSGISRSGRLDFRYLIANAMQAFTAQPLAKQQDNPFSNSYLLATLIIPHLETYLAAHSEVRFLLLEYPPDHLATVLALQKLVGVDLIKVAQIVDSDSNEALPFTHIRGASIAARGTENQLLSPRPNSASNMKPSPTPPNTESLSYTKANFLLTNTATDSEISTFIATVWKILLEISSFYASEEQHNHSHGSGKNYSSQRRAVTPVSGSYSPFPKASQSPPLSPPASATFSGGQAHRPPSADAASLRAPSFAETIKTMKSIRDRVSRRKSTMVPDEEMPVLDLDDVEFEDMEEKRLMPIFMKRPPIRKGNSRKALKFLGLA